MNQIDQLIKLYCEIDDFNRANKVQYGKHLCLPGNKTRKREIKLSLSEAMTIVIWYHYSKYRDFKSYYRHLELYHSKDFDLVSYSRFIQLLPRLVIPLCAFSSSNPGQETGISFVDSTPLKVCNIKRATRNKVFENIAAKGKSSMGWFFGFKLHVVINHLGSIIKFAITPGNVSDHRPVPSMCKSLFGKLFGDKGYISKSLSEALMKNNVLLITHIRKNMKNKLLLPIDAILLRKRSLVESVFNLLKNGFNLEHSRYRSPTSFIVNTLAAISAYSCFHNKPSFAHLMLPA